MAACPALEVAPDIADVAPDMAEWERHRVIIAAAVAAVAGSGARISRIREVPGPAPSAWTRQGRAELQRHDLRDSLGVCESDWRGGAR